MRFFEDALPVGEGNLDFDVEKMAMSVGDRNKKAGPKAGFQLLETNYLAGAAGAAAASAGAAAASAGAAAASAAGAAAASTGAAGAGASMAGAAASGAGASSFLPQADRATASRAANSTEYFIGCSLNEVDQCINQVAREARSNRSGKF